MKLFCDINLFILYICVCMCVKSICTYKYTVYGVQYTPRLTF